MENNEYGKLVDFLGKKFDKIDSKFDAIDNKFDAIDSKLDAIDSRFEAIDGRLEAIDGRFEAIDKRFDAMDSRFDAIEKNFATKEDLKEGLEGVERRTGILFEEVNHKIDLVIEGQQGIIQKLGGQIEENESEHIRLEHMVMEDRADIYNIKKRLS